jgi:hypothetical protein
MRMKIKIDFTIIAIATILALYLVSPLFSSGIPLNTDSPCQYLRISCLNKDASVPNNWCNLWQAGVPSSQYYYPPIDYLTHFFSLLIGMELAYKIMVVLALFLPAIGAYIFLRSRGNPVAGAIAFAFLLLQKGSWHIGGFEETILVGMWPYVMTTGFWIICLTFYIKFLEKPSTKNLILAAIFTPFLTHPITLVISAITYLIISIYKYNEIKIHYKKFLQLILLIVLLNGYYWLPLLTKLSFFPGALGGGLNWNEFYAYILSNIPWWISLFAVLGIISIFIFKDEKNNITAVTACSIFAIMLLNFIKWPITKYLAGLRLGGYIIIATYIAAALAIYYLSNIKINKSKQIFSLIALLIVIFTAFTLFTTTQQYSKSILLSDMPQFSSQIEIYKALKQLPNARVMTEETLYNFGNYPQSFTHSHCALPIYSDKELIGSGLVIFPRNMSVMDITWASSVGSIFGKKIGDLSDNELKYYLNKYNIKYVIAHTQPYINYFANRSAGYKVVEPFVLFDTGIQPNYFEIKNGTIISSEYYENYAKAQITVQNKTVLALKTNFYANWKAYINNKKATPYYCDGIMCLDVYEDGLVEFKYGNTAADWIGYLLSITGILLIIIYLKKNERT